MARAKGNARAVRRRAFATLALLVLALAGWAWWQAGEWQPSRSRFPVQGAELDSREGEVNLVALKAAGADFVYLATDRGLRFEDGLEAARNAGLQVGAVQRFDLCRDTASQIGGFVTQVPRDPKLLPPAVELDLDETNCPAPPAPEALQSELTTFLNQLERHTGKPAVLKLSKRFEERYRFAAMIDRTIWATGGWWPLDGYLAPGYAGRPWTMWTANPRLRSPAAEGRIHWVVVRP